MHVECQAGSSGMSGRSMLDLYSYLSAKHYHTSYSGSCLAQSLICAFIVNQSCADKAKDQGHAMAASSCTPAHIISAPSKAFALF